MDEGKLGRQNIPTTAVNIEGTTKPVEFPPITKEDLEEIRKLSFGLINKLTFRDKNDNIKVKPILFSRHTGLDEPVGGGDSIYYNTIMTCYQFLFALAMTRHPFVKKMIAPEFNPSESDIENLVEKKIMSGIKILDMGCGPKPTFARCCRVLGAEVWTVDNESDFRYYRPTLPKDQCDLEDQMHIELDLVNVQAVDIIRKRSMGDFNLITEANLYLKSPSVARVQSKDIAMPLLKKGGVHENHRDFEIKE